MGPQAVYKTYGTIELELIIYDQLSSSLGSFLDLMPSVPLFRPLSN
jgi:hypothetical protein